MGLAIAMKKNPNLHGNAPDDAPVALLLIDVINDMEFPGGAELLRHALPAAKRIAAFKQRCKRAGIPAIYPTTISDGGDQTLRNRFRTV